MAYAARTKVQLSQSKADIERLVTGAGARKFMSGTDEDGSMVAFELLDRRIQFFLPNPTETGNKDPHQVIRARWRALLLCIKAKLESVASGIETMEEAFLPHIVTNTGKTIGSFVIPHVMKVIESGKLPPMIESRK